MARKATQQKLTEQAIEKEKTDLPEVRPDTELERRLRAVLSRTITYFENYVFPEAYEIIKQKLLFAGDRAAVLIKAGVSDRSNMIYPLISAVHDTFCANLYDTETKSSAVARTADAQDKAQDAQDFFDWCYGITDADDQKELIRNEATLIGTSYGAGGFDSKKRTYEWVNAAGVLEKQESADIYATLDYVSFFDMFYEPSLSDFYKGRWKARRSISPYKHIKDKFANLIDFKEWEDEILTSTQYISTKDYKRVWDIKSYEKQYTEAALKFFAAKDVSLQDFMYDNFYQVQFRDNELCEMIEYWEDDKLIIMINGRVYYDGISPFPGGDPFGIVTYERRPGTCRGIGIGHKLMSHQKQVNSYWNACHDAINMHIKPMYLVPKGGIVGKDGKTPERIMWKDGAVLETRVSGVANGGISPLQWVDFNVLTFAQNAIRDLLAEAQEIIGTNSYSQGGQGKVERSFGAVNAKLGVVRARLQPIIKSMNTFDQKMFETWVSTATVVMPDTVMIRILGDSASWKEIRPLDILGKFDVVAENEANRQATKEQRAQVVISTLQSLQPYLINPATQLPNIDNKDLLKYVFDQLNFNGIKIYDFEESKKFVDEAAEMAMYKQEKQPVNPQGAPVEGQPVPQEPSLPPQMELPSEDPLERQAGQSDEDFYLQSGIVGQQ